MLPSAQFNVSIRGLQPPSSSGQNSWNLPLFLFLLHIIHKPTSSLSFYPESSLSALCC